MRIYLRGKTYWCEFIVDKIKHRFSCKTQKKEVAREVAAALHADVVRKKFDIPAKYKAKKIFGDVWEEYLKNQSTAKDTIRRSIIASKHFLPVFKDKPASDIKNIDIEQYQRIRRLEILKHLKNINKKDSEISFRSVNYELVVLHHFFNYCIKYGIIDKNPATGIKKLNELSRLKTLSDDDIQKLVAGATNKLTRDLITFLIFTGCRKGEALNLKWGDVDLENGVIAIKGTKTKYDRHIPISGPLKELLSGIAKQDSCEYVFNIASKKIGNFRKSFMTACKNAGLKDLRIHDLRHVFASKMVMNGTSLYITGELLGHRTTQMTKRYSHLVPETLRKAVNDVWKKK